MSANQQPIAGHGPTAIEEQILDRIDANESVAQIAQSMGLTPARVRTVISNFQEGRSDRWEARVRQASRELLAAIRRLQARSA